MEAKRITMKKHFAHRMTKRERAAVNVLYGPFRIVDGGGTVAAYSEQSYLDTTVDPTDIKADIKFAATNECALQNEKLSTSGL